MSRSHTLTVVADNTEAKGEEQVTPNLPVVAVQPVVSTPVNPLFTPEEITAGQTLIKMFYYRRPGGSTGDKCGRPTQDFAKEYIAPLGATADLYGNWKLRIPRLVQDGETVVTVESKVLFSCHIDTVHGKPGRQKVKLNTHTGMLSLHKEETDSNCLGADCTTGAWLMIEMAKAGVPGLYIWHEDEESGGQGSRYIAKHAAASLTGIQAAIAFDRKGYDNIITSQAGGKCCSDTFANSLSALLPLWAEKPYRCDPTGTFTDTANYTDIIPECTNISVGYFSQHTSSETQDVMFAMKLRRFLIRFDETKLVIERKPGDRGISRYTQYNYGGHGYSRSNSFRSDHQPAYDYYDYDNWDYLSSRHYGGGAHGGGDLFGGRHTRNTAHKDWREIWAGTGKEEPEASQKLPEEYLAKTVKEFIKLYPDEVADYLEQWGVGLRDLYEAHPHVE